jgi:APA family basic amino acid/polyamine antiporter
MEESIDHPPSPPEERNPLEAAAPAALESLPAVLGLFSALTIVIGEVIGSGVFIKPNIIAQSTHGYVGLILLLWIVCGLVNLCGALAQAELAAMYPHAGGVYVFLREAYGRIWGFLWGWGEFWVIRSGAIAALGTALGITLTELLMASGSSLAIPLPTLQKSIAIAAILGLATVNVIGTRWGGAVQNVTTAIKAGFLLFLAVLPFVAAREHSLAGSELWPRRVEVSLLAGIGSALAGIMWAYDGWGQVTVIAEEIRNPRRNVPLALAGGVLILVALYTGANLGYHLTLPSAAIAAAPIPAVAVTQALLGDWGARLMLAMILVSVFGAMNSNILVGPRVLFAVARDHDFLSPLRHVDPRFRTPAIAIGTLCGWSILLILGGDLRLPGGTEKAGAKPLFDVLTEYAIFGGSLFYLAAVVAVYVLRRKRPDVARPYRTWAYPASPAVFIGFYLFLLATMLWAAPRQCLTGLLLIGLGGIVYWLCQRGKSWNS